MKKGVLICFVLFICKLLFNSTDAYSWDNEVTHKDLSYYAAENSVLSKEKGDYLKTVGFNQGLNEVLGWQGRNWTIFKWIQEGAYREDEGTLGEMKSNEARFNNHFHNPLKSFDAWGSAGLSDYIAIYPFHVYGESSAFWAQDGVRQSAFRNSQSEWDWSWQTIRAYFYRALISTTDAERQEYFARTFRGLGHQMHLLQDMAVPAHVRNDAHPMDSLKKVGDLYFESWAAKNRTVINGFANNPQFPSVAFDVSKEGLIPITQLFDTDQYTPGTVPSVSLSFGLSEYTNLNFVSDDTIFTENYVPNHRHYFPYPRYSSECYQVFDSLDSVTSKKMRYMSKVCDGEVIKHFAFTGPFFRYIRGAPSMQKSRFKLDKNTYYDYAEKLIPRAVGYSAGLLDYFFRGEMGVKVIPRFTNNVLDQLTLVVRNYTPTKETMRNGYFSLAYQYTKKDSGATVYGVIPYTIGMNLIGVAELPYGKNTDGSDNDSKVEITFDSFPHSIALDEYPSVRFSLAYFGDLGAERAVVASDGSLRTYGAVIGKVFKGGKILFNEEWNNGLSGNYQWCHGINEPDSINISNVLEGGVLIKDNSRRSDYLDAHVNQTLLSANVPQCNRDSSMPIPVTRDTHLLFKIDEMTITNPPVLADGSTAHYQALWFNFSDGVSLQISLLGQFVGYPNTGYFTFVPGGSMRGNIYEMFRQVGIPVAEPLTLRSINIVQQLAPHYEESGDCNQHMETDFIRIIDAKPVE